MNPISAISQVDQIGQISKLQEAARHGSAGSTSGLGKSDTAGGFADLIQGYVKQTNDAQKVADTAIQDFATGKTDNVQQVVMAMASADMSFQLFMEIRNKLIDSYNDLMRMQF